MSDDEVEQTCDQCKESVKLFEPDSKCCDKKICKDCLDCCSTCESCEASLCNDCDQLACQACEEKDDQSALCKKCSRECAYCTRDFCPQHLISTLVQMDACKTCSKQPCLDKTHPKESYNFVLCCIECSVEETQEAKKRKRFFAQVNLKKSKKQ